MITRIAVLLLVVLLGAGCVPVSHAQSLPEPELAALDGLWIDMSMDPAMVTWFNEHARPNDIARADHVSLVDLLDKVTTGRRLVVFKNVSDAEQLLPHLVGKMDIIGYNLEHGPSNRPDEQADPVGSVRRMRALADEYGLELAFGPDRAFALSDGVAMAPYVDMFVLQVQRVQEEPDVVRSFVLPMAEALKAANPDVEISVQVRTEGDMAAVAKLIASMEDKLDGVSILTSPETTAIAEKLVAELRPPTDQPPANPKQTPVPSGDLQAVALPSPTTESRRTLVAVQPGAVASIPAPVSQAAGVRSWALLAGLFTLSVIALGLVTTMAIYSYQNYRAR
jgi:hypothetical protein